MSRDHPLKICILGSPRTGTHLLGSILEENHIQQFGEVLNAKDNEFLKTFQFPWDYRKYLDDKIENLPPYFQGGSFQVFRIHVEEVLSQVGLHSDDLSILLMMDYLFPGFYFIHLYRKNRICQFVSCWYAGITGSFHRDTRGDYDSLREPSIDFDANDPERVSHIQQMWDKFSCNAWFDLLPSIPHCNLEYEEVWKNPWEVAIVLSAYLGYPLKKPVQNRFLKQKSTTKDEIIKEFATKRLEEFLDVCKIPEKDHQNYREKADKMLGEKLFEVL